MKKFSKFCIVGICNTVITFCIYYMLSEQVGINYMVSSFAGYVAGVANSFTMNRHWTFHSKDCRVLAQFVRFAVINTISLGVNLLVLYICVERIAIHKLPAQCVAIGLSTIVNFTGNKIAVFQEQENGNAF